MLVLTTIAVAPASASVQVGTVQQFSATALDQAGTRMDPQPTVSWSVSGGGSISATGMFTAGPTAGGPFTVTATSGSVNGSATVMTTAAPEFAISVSPASASVKRGQTASYQVPVAPANGFTASVSLSVAGLPPGSKAEFSPNPADTTSALSVRTSKSTREGTYSLTITGKYGTLSRTTSATLTVTK